MKRIKYIAQNELYALFFSPIAWILMVVFIVLTAADYVDVADRFVGLYQRGGPALWLCEYLTRQMTTDTRMGIFFGVIRNLYLFLPLITMGLISREMSSGTIKLLQSSPLKIREIVLGKYVAMLCFIVCLMVLLGIVLAPLCWELFHPDYSQLVASLFGLFLVLGTYAAIGLFISSLTSYQIVAAIATFAIFLLLSKVGDLWQDVDVVRNITYYMNIGGKTYNFITGLLNLRDLCYFMIIIGGFLLFTIIKIKSGMESISRWKKARRYLAVIGVAFVVAYITNKPQVNVYFDATRNKVLTITPHTQEMLAKLNDGGLEITAYCNMFHAYYMFRPASQNNLIDNLWGPYIRFKSDINFKFVYYYNLDTSDYHFKIEPGKSLKQIAEKEIKTWRVGLDEFLSPEEVNKQVNTNEEECRSFFVLRYKGKSSIVRTFDDNDFFPSENEISATINRMIGVPPKIDFVTGEIERGPFSERTRDYKAIASKKGFRHSLINQGYDFDTLSLKDKEIPTGLTALVVADPRAPITSGNLEKLNHYIDGGNNLLIASEPDRKEVTKPLFDKLGLSLRDGMLIQSSDKFSSDIAFTYLTDSAKNLSPQFARSTSDAIKYYGDPLLKVAMAGAGAMEYQEKDGFHICPLLASDKNLSWNRVAPISNDSLQLKVGRLPSDEPGSFATALRMNRNIKGKDQRIVVTSDADYISSPQMWGEEPTRYNFDFGFWCFSYFSHGEFPTNTLRPKSIDNGFSITVDAIPTQKFVFYWIIPALIVVLASVILIRRKRK